MPLVTCEPCVLPYVASVAEWRGSLLCLTRSVPFVLEGLLYAERPGFSSACETSTRRCLWLSTDAALKYERRNYYSFMT
eukprot:5871072-Amphidinium_carterae.1